MPYLVLTFFSSFSSSRARPICSLRSIRFVSCPILRYSIGSACFCIHPVRSSGVRVWIVTRAGPPCPFLPTYAYLYCSSVRTSVWQTVRALSDANTKLLEMYCIMTMCTNHVTSNLQVYDIPPELLQIPPELLRAHAHVLAVLYASCRTPTRNAYSLVHR